MNQEAGRAGRGLPKNINKDNNTMIGMIDIIIDGQKIAAFPGEKLLFTALRHKIYIPHLCAAEEAKHQEAACRLCFVEIEGVSSPVTACTQSVVAGMIVRTRSPAVDRLVRTAFELLLSAHRLGCGECAKNTNCALQEIAAARGLKLQLKRLKSLPVDELPRDESPGSFAFDPSRCVLCGRCVRADRSRARGAGGVSGTPGAIGFAGRGLRRRITTFADHPIAQSPCTECGACVEACPVGALYWTSI